MFDTQIKIETVDINFKDLPCRDFDWDCLAVDDIIPFGSYRKCQNYDRLRGKCLFVNEPEKQKKRQPVQGCLFLNDISLAG